MRTIVEARGLVKTYGEVRALDGLDLAAAQGSVLALLGPNGAGKSTAVSILTTLVAPSAGTAMVAGADVVSDPARVRERIGVAGQHTPVRRLGRFWRPSAGAGSERIPCSAMIEVTTSRLGGGAASTLAPADVLVGCSLTGDRVARRCA